ncbi:MAG TPA: hypothetical protein VIP77_05520 [Jiangellaceae bacterium]
MPIVTTRIESIHYDGTNKAAILAWCVDVTLVSDVDGVLTLHRDEPGDGGIDFDFVLSPGDWLIRNLYRQYVGRHTEAEYAQIWVEIPEAS